MKIPVAERVKESRLPLAQPGIGRSDKLLFSFEAIERNDYFNLDATCQNWASDLFLTLQQASKIAVCDIFAGKYSGDGSPLRIHSHSDVKKPCAIPKGVALEDMWQIRVGKSKGGIHGVFVENVFYVIWFDPQHNLYPDKNHGGLKKIVPPLTCCKDRDLELNELREKYSKLKEDYKVAEELLRQL